MQITGLALYTVIFSLVVLSITLRLYKQVIQNRDAIKFLMSEWYKSNTEQNRRNREQCQQ